MRLFHLQQGPAVAGATSLWTSESLPIQPSCHFLLLTPKWTDLRYRMWLLGGVGGQGSGVGRQGGGRFLSVVGRTCSVLAIRSLQEWKVMKMWSLCGQNFDYLFIYLFFAPQADWFFFWNRKLHVVNICSVLVECKWSLLLCSSVKLSRFLSKTPERDAHCSQVSGVFFNGLNYGNFFMSIDIYLKKKNNVFFFFGGETLWNTNIS